MFSLRKDEIVRHVCKDNILCIEPTHLVIGDVTDNNRDKWRDGTMYRGSSHHLTKLTEDDIRIIRARYASGETVASLAAGYAVSWPTIDRIVKRLTWMHVE